MHKTLAHTFLRSFAKLAARVLPFVEKQTGQISSPHSFIGGMRKVELLYFTSIAE